MTDGNGKNRDEYHRKPICGDCGNAVDLEGVYAVGDDELEIGEAAASWSRDTERLVKAMRNALPPDHPLTADADRWLDDRDYWIEDIVADREIPPLEPGEGKFERPSACDCEEEHPPGPLRGEAAKRFYEES